MDVSLYSITDTTLAEVKTETLIIQTAADGADLVGNLYFQGFDGVILLKRHLAPAFFDLQTGRAGEVLQKFSTYRIRLAIVGDFSQRPSQSLRDFIQESNRLGQVSFVGSVAEARQQLARHE